MLTTWRYVGTKASYLADLSASFAFRGDPSLTAELYAFASSFVVLTLVSLLIVTLVLGESLVAYGLATGDRRFGIKALLILSPVMVLLAYPSARQAPRLR